MKTIQGIVTSVKTPKTAQVAVERQWQHPTYLKSVKRTKTYACHVEGVEVAEGDTVLIEPTRPMSRTKRFQVVRKVE